MKRSLMILACLISLAVTAQNASTVNITVIGTRNKEIKVDGTAYLVNTDASSTTSVNLPIQITNLTTGQHTIEIVRTNRFNTSNNTGNKSFFNLRSGFDINITVNNDGSIQTSETRIRRTNTGNQTRNRNPMSEANFDALMESIQNLRMNTKVTAITKAFNTTSNYFTSLQAMELIGLINSQASRLSLAKASYKTITDPANFSEINDLILSQAGRTDLAAYVKNYDKNNPRYGTSFPNYSKVAMTDANFNILYNRINNEGSTGAKMTSLTNEFNNSNNYFTTAQIRQLIQLVSDENSRLQLAKLAYNNAVDKANYYNQLSTLLSSQYTRNELDVYVRANSNNSSNPAKIAMSDANYNNLYTRINNEWSNGAKMTSLTNEFNNSNNYFTTIQTRQLIQLVSDENSRLQLAKLAYNNVMDPANYYDQLHTLLTSQSSRNELDAYLRANGSTSTGYPTNNTGYPTRIAMSDANYNNLYTRINNEWGLGAKMTILTDEFNNSNNFFTSTQTRQLIQLVSDENSRLQLAKLAYDNVLDPANYYDQLYTLLTSQSSRNELDAYVRANGSTSTGYPTNNTGYPTRIAMSDANYNNLYTRINNEWGLGAKMTSLNNEFNNANNYFTSAQTGQLIQLVSDENNRLQLAKLAYDNLVDPANYYNQLSSLFSSTSSRNELDAYIKGIGNSNTVSSARIAMSDASFTNMFNSIRNQYGFGVKMSALTNEFNNSINLFSTTQARQLIQLVSDENNRLILAKSSYDNIVDPENFTKLYDVLATQSTRNELAEYVRLNPQIR